MLLNTMQNFNGEKTLEFTFLSEKEKKTVCLKSVNKPMKSSSKCVKRFYFRTILFSKGSQGQVSLLKKHSGTICSVWGIVSIVI